MYFGKVVNGSTLLTIELEVEFLYILTMTVVEVVVIAVLATFFIKLSSKFNSLLSHEISSLFQCSL